MNKLKSQYTVEMIQDLKAMYGIDIETEITNLFSDAEIHLIKLKSELDEIQPELFSDNTKIKELMYKIANHKEVYPEYYL